MSDNWNYGANGPAGNGLDFIADQNKEEWSRENRTLGWLKESLGPNLQKYLWSPPAQSTPAIEAAVAVVQSYMKEKEEKRMSQEVAVTKKQPLALGDIESVFIKGDISKMNEVQRVEYVREVCRSLGLNPLTNPFDYISFQGKIQLYAKKGATDQLRGNYNISMTIVSQTIEDGILTVTAQASFPDGRKDEDVGVVSIAGLKGEALANAKMKAVTKAKRRVTLSICGLGMMDESETDSISGAVKGERVFEQEKVIAPKWSPSKDQIARLYAIAKSAGLDQATLKQHIKNKYGHDSTLNLLREEYDEVCNTFEAKPVAAIEVTKESVAEMATASLGQWNPYDDKMDANEDLT